MLDKRFFLNLESFDIITWNFESFFKDFCLISQFLPKYFAEDCLEVNADL